MKNLLANLPGQMLEYFKENDKELYDYIINENWQKEETDRMKFVEFVFNRYIASVNGESLPAWEPGLLN